MATTGTLTVDKVYLEADMETNGTYIAVACQTDISLELSTDLIEKLCKDTGGGVSYDEGPKRWTASLSALLALDSTLGGVDLYDLWAAGTTWSLKVQLGAATGDVTLTGNVIISSLSINSAGGAGAYATYSASLQGIGLLTKAAVA
jgi:predicted secreted protein